MATAKKKEAGPWLVFEYEAMMYRQTSRPIPLPEKTLPDIVRLLINALTESRVLHNRILCDILSSRCPEPDEIRLTDLLPGFSSPEVANLEKAYGSGRIPKSPCWTFNKMLAHATTERFDGFDYGAEFALLGSHIEKLLDEIAAERKKRGI
jgi:hypothetical protein